LRPTEVLESLTAIRRQTAVDEKTGAPEEGSLRSMRVVLRNTPFVAELHFDEDPDQTAKALLAACVLSLRRAGTGRNRGRGRLTARLYDQQGNDITGEWFEHFRRLVKGGAP
jgi:CRISPR/Cas system CSM-associated protein Csm3 (group 7 of RAMP superfamily)